MALNRRMLRISRLIGLVTLSGCAAMGACAFSQGDVGLAGSHARLEQRVELGKQLFNDSHLSASDSIRCASCHIPEKQYTDGRKVAQGVGGRVGTRNTPSLMIIGDSEETSFFWDGRRRTLDQAVLDPLTNPVEMGLTGQAEVVNRVRQTPAYAHAFASAFPEANGSVTSEQIAAALGDYIQSLRSPESNYDRYVLRGDKSALSPRALLGLAVFENKGRCAECHLLKPTPAGLTDHAYHRTGVGLDTVAAELSNLSAGVIQRSLQGNEIGNRVATHADEAELGRFNVTQDPADIGLFRTPSLRNVSHTAPYMHNGSVATLGEAIDREIYYRGLQEDRPLNLSVDDRANLKAFLESL